MQNIFKNLPEELSEEVIENLLVTEKVKIERIISRGHSSPENFWYDQDTNEFVLLMQGEAELSFENEKSIKLLPGDWLIIPSHKKHRVEYTSKLELTLWLTVHY